MEEEKVVDVEEVQEQEDDYGFEDITFDAADHEQEDSQPEEVEEEKEEETSDSEPEPDDSTAVEQPVDNGDTGDDDEDLDEVSSLRAQNESLLQHIENLSGQLVSGNLPAATIPEPSGQPAKPNTLPQTSDEIMNFLENTSVDELLEDPTKFNAVLNQVSKRSTDVAVQNAVRHVLSSVPELVMGYITRHSTMNRMVDEFYRENSDLVNVKQTVAAVANDVHAKNPGLSVEQVFKQSADATRKLLGIKKQALAAAKRKPAKPAFAKAGGARKKAPEVSNIQSQINDLISGDF